MAYQEEGYRLGPMFILLDLVHLLELPHSFVILLPLQFLLLRQLEGPHSIILVLAHPQTLFLVKDSHPLDYDRIQALPRHSRHLH